MLLLWSSYRNIQRQTPLFSMLALEAEVLLLANTHHPLTLPVENKFYTLTKRYIEYDTSVFAKMYLSWV